MSLFTNRSVRLVPVILLALGVFGGTAMAEGFVLDTVTCGPTTFCTKTSKGGLRPSDMDGLVALADSCVIRAFGEAPGMSHFEHGRGLDAQGCLTTKSQGSSSQAAAGGHGGMSFFAKCCVKEVAGGTCQLVCQKVGAR